MTFGLLDMDRIGQPAGDAEPVVARGATDLTVDEMDVTVREFYQKALDQQVARANCPRYRPARHLQRISGAAKTFVRRLNFCAENRKFNRQD